ncbi:hypothetical protein A6E01_19850 (plasmid) [Vibrio breoganii]|uniref:Uncharacterized protein n=1 Tax=Vibrio breoganii TaxID=553239 RepID=A0AAN0XZX1_9VIBR|nr:zinc-finger-containing protein [Vibrio breoganii]ANO35469.1 hypothetical protein A6E01_19850 [Vibrio breoganii]PML13928.1 hypothetical protein BCT84_12270 [Vibrio breoganii]
MKPFKTGDQSPIHCCGCKTTVSALLVQNKSGVMGWVCTTCRANVKAHSKTLAPIGTLADEQMKIIRNKLTETATIMLNETNEDRAVLHKLVSTRFGKPLRIPLISTRDEGLKAHKALKYVTEMLQAETQVMQTW